MSRLRSHRLALAALLLIGLGLRMLSFVGSRPTLPSIQDGYQTFAHYGPFRDPLHPAGYSLIIALLGRVTRNVAVLVSVQHLLGFATALTFGAAVRRVTNSPWPALLPVALVLFSGDEIVLEHSVMSESWEIFLESLGLYATVRAWDAPSPVWRWPMAAGVFFAAAGAVRTAALPLIAVAALSQLIATGRLQRLINWRAPLALVVTAAIALLGYAICDSRFGSGFNVGPSPGWYLYADAAQFADCHDFTAPVGTTALCQASGEATRPSAYTYLFDPHSPAVRAFGSIGRQDRLVGGWARRAIEAQPLDQASSAWGYLHTYYVPSSIPSRLKPSAAGSGLDPDLSFTWPNPFFGQGNLQALWGWFDHFTVYRHHWALSLLRHWQKIFRFGATMLFVTTVLTLGGLLVGPRRSRNGVLLFGVGGFSLLLAPCLSGTYTGRYTVPLGPPLVAASAIALFELVRRGRSRRLRPVKSVEAGPQMVSYGE